MLPPGQISGEVLRRSTEKYSATHSMAGGVFEAVIHKVLPTCPNLTLFQMVREPEKEKGDSNTFVRYLSLTQSSKKIRVNFVRTDTIPFIRSAPNHIQLPFYYKGCRTTPLIDSFLLRKNDTSVIVYLLQIVASQKKETHSLIGGPQLVTGIIENVKLAYSLPITLRFVLVEPAEDIPGVEPKHSWELPHPDVLCHSYEVYRCNIPIPDRLLVLRHVFPSQGVTLF